MLGSLCFLTFPDTRKKEAGVVPAELPLVGDHRGFCAPPLQPAPWALL